MVYNYCCRPLQLVKMSYFGEGFDKNKTALKPMDAVTKSFRGKVEIVSFMEGRITAYQSRLLAGCKLFSQILTPHDSLIVTFYSFIQRIIPVFFDIQYQLRRAFVHFSIHAICYRFSTGENIFMINQCEYFKNQVFSTLNSYLKHYKSMNSFTTFGIKRTLRLSDNLLLFVLLTNISIV